MTDFFELGRISKPQGIKGEVKIEAYTDSLDRFDYLEFIYFKEADEYRKINIKGVRTDAKNAYLLIDGVKDRNDAELLRGKMIYIDRANAAKLPPGHYYISDLVGLSVRNSNGAELGRLSDILQTGTRDIYVVKLAQGGGVMFPSLDDVVVERNVEEGYIQINEEKLQEVAVYDV